jgi:hypothetical protein
MASMSLRIRSAVAALLTCSAAAACADVNRSASQPGESVVRVLIRASGSGRPLEGAHVFVVSHRGEIVAEAYTDPAGLAGLPPLADEDQPWLVVADPRPPKTGAGNGETLGMGVAYWSSHAGQICIEVPSLAACNIPVAGTPTAPEEGKGCENPVIMVVRNQNEGITQELQWVGKHFPKGRIVRQILGRCGDRPVDILEIQAADGSSGKVYFDIGSYFRR